MTTKEHHLTWLEALSAVHLDHVNAHCARLGLTLIFMLAMIKRPKALSVVGARFRKTSLTCTLLLPSTSWMSCSTLSYL